jgi:coenzyme F420-dependent glucose-6-phosphate dehydrogenase
MVLEGLKDSMKFGGTGMVKLGLKIGPEQYTPSEMLRQTIAAEESGYDGIDVSDHFHPWSEEG